MTKTFKLIFSSILIISTLISISSYSWFGMWMGLEINLLAIIPILQMNNNYLSAESSIKYFIVQAVASTMILMSIIISSFKSKILFNELTLSSSILMMNLSLLTKMGMAPFHFWFPEVLEGLSWMNCILILTWQKLAPMVLLMYNMEFSKSIIIIIIVGVIISGVMSFNQISIRKLMAYSSINHMSWMISSMLVLKTIWMIYFLIYSIMTLNILLILNYYKIYFLNQLFQTMNNFTSMKFFFILNFMSLSGIPPFIGFLPKWLTIQMLINEKMYFLTLIMIIFTLVMIFIYMRISVSSLMMSINENSWKTNIFNKSMSMMTMNFILISSLILVTLSFNLN
uniref:NADH-ubiquinone oxidoreductase chain 2 n=1 Tax=Rhagophthalmus lufengensis TaxID=398797 RepID=A4UAV6_9COLE|nr:NADH dehydrogenase subunit 2 [Rhagophthalmus lufengensis]ABI14539.1 NADH dehydrogenase subunit 2 [Rhagophthalmus lufengensis]